MTCDELAALKHVNRPMTTSEYVAGMRHMQSCEACREKLFANLAEFDRTQSPAVVAASHIVAKKLADMCRERLATDPEV